MLWAPSVLAWFRPRSGSWVDFGFQIQWSVLPLGRGGTLNSDVVVCPPGLIGGSMDASTSCLDMAIDIRRRPGCIRSRFRSGAARNRNSPPASIVSNTSRLSCTAAISHPARAAVIGLFDVFAHGDDATRQRSRRAITTWRSKEPDRIQRRYRRRVCGQRLDGRRTVGSQGTDELSCANGHTSANGSHRQSFGDMKLTDGQRDISMMSSSS